MLCSWHTITGELSKGSELICPSVYSTMLHSPSNPSGTALILFLIILISRAASRDILPLRSSFSVEELQSNVLQSPDGTFSCGFYSIYANAFTFSIWYSNSAQKTIIWSANRDRPVHSRRSMLTLQKDGSMVLTDYDGTVVWHADGVDARYAHLLDTGNLVLEGTSGNILWQSFDSPTDTLVPTQPVTATTKLVSATQLHVSGHYIFRFSDMSILSLIYNDPDVSDIYWPNPDAPFFENSRRRYNNTRLGVLDYLGQFVSSDFAVQQALVASDAGPGIKRRLTLDPDGNLRIYSLNSTDGSWSVSMVVMPVSCKIHGFCGPNGICHYSPVPSCSCLPGYKMVHPGDWSQGCTAIVNTTCGAAQPVRFLKLPNTDFWGNDQQILESISFQACKDICTSDCTCKGFLYVQGIGLCFQKSLLFSGRSYPSSDPRTMYIKLPVSVNISNMSIPQSNVLDSSPNVLKCDDTSTRVIQLFPDDRMTGSGDSKWTYFYGFVAATFVIETIFISTAWLFVSRRELRPAQTLEGYKVLSTHFRRYSYKELEMATANFKDELGRGGSGVVYKGILDDDRVIAVKRLENVRQGKQEFQSELRIIGRINHMNLARIWGFCSESIHRMLVYEFIENGSLATILFNSNILVGWKQRFNIALGVAKGLSYLHHECLEWVIHCDVKPENILLDQNFEPKIIDFGLAKLLRRSGSNQIISQLRGTVGYIAPEWVSGLPITGKVDVYSYGVVLLELVSGTRVSDVAVGLDDELHKELRKLVRTLSERINREEHAWIAEFVDFRLNGQLDHCQARMLIKLAVSCLQEDRNKRPTMEAIVRILLSSTEADISMDQVMENEISIYI